MRRGCWMIAILFVAWLTIPASAAPPSNEEMRRAVQQLGDENFTTREKAMRLLWNAGEAAEPVLKEAMNHSDPEVSRRVRVLMDRIVYRIDPGTPPEVVSLVRKYRNGSADEQIGILREMLRIGSKAHPYMVRMLNAVDAQRRKIILEQFAFDDWKVLAPLMIEGQTAVVEDIITLAVAAQIESIIPHHAAFHAQSPKLAERISSLRAEVERSNNTSSARLLLALYRVKNDADGMLWAAQKSDQPETIRLLLQERGQWSEILDKHPPVISEGLSKITGLGFLAAYERLAGRGKAFDDTLKMIDEYVGSPKPRKDNRPAYAAKALLINEQTARGISVLLAHDQFASAADLLIAQGKYREALQLTERGAKAESGQKYYDRATHILLLQRVGLIDPAKDLLASLQKDMARVTDPPWVERQIEMEAKLGLREQALKHLQERIDQNDGSYLAPAFSHLFPLLSQRAETLYRLLRLKSPKESTPDIFQRMQAIEERKHKPDELADMLKSAAPTTTWLPGQSFGYAFENLASLVLWLDLPDVAQALLAHAVWEKAPGHTLLLLADTLAAADRWEQATAAYRKIFESDKSAALPYFLYGWSLTKVGKADEGRAIMDRTHRMYVGSEPARHWFHAALLERGFLDDAAKEMAARRILMPRDPYYLGQLQTDMARAAAAKGDFLEAAAISERNLLRLLTANLGYRGMSAYIRATSSIHIYRARGFLDQDKLPEALREIERAESLHEAHLDLPITLVAALEKKGHKAKADQIHQRLEQILEKVCQDYPACADAHNQAAWLAVRCRRNLDAALKYSQRAVELAPSTAAYADTLAEVYFQRGERAKSIELIKKCLKMPAANVGFYRLQLQRFTSGDPKDEPAFE